MTQTQERFNHDFTHIVQPLECKKIAIAVSGGADSIALLYLVSSWIKNLNIELVVLSVDHNLRLESKNEITYVKQVADKLGHKFIALSWKHDHSKIAIQERARQARYHLMSIECHNLGISTLLTAHHLDDISETYLMRKKRNSGCFGLSHSNSFFFENIRVLRPLYNMHKSELITYLEGKNIKWCEDASNNSDLYERNRTRKQITSFSNRQKIELINEVHSVNQHAHKLNQELIQAMAESLQINNYGFALVSLKILKESSIDIKIQILSYILTIISGNMTVPRFRNIKQLMYDLEQKEKIHSSLHGCIIKGDNNSILIFRENANISTNIQSLDFLQYWDNRFDIISDKQLAGHYIDNINLDDYIKIKDKINLNNLAKMSDNNHKLILFTLPAIRHLEKIVAIPNISYYDGFNLDANLRVIFRPSFVSRFTHFF